MFRNSEPLIPSTPKKLYKVVQFFGIYDGR